MPLSELETISQSHYNRITSYCCTRAKGTSEITRVLTVAVAAVPFVEMLEVTHYLVGCLQKL